MPRTTLALPLLLVAAPAAALQPSAFDGLSCDGGALPDGASALTAAVETLLDRAGISPGAIDGEADALLTAAIEAFETREGLEVDGAMDAEVLSALGGGDAAPYVMEYEITEEDAADLVDAIPETYPEMAEMERMGFTSVAEKLAERFHMALATLEAMNDGSGFAPGDTIAVLDPGAPLEGQAARIEVDVAAERVVALDADGAILASYPAVVGSDENPSPSGEVEVTALAMDPNFTYRPEVNFQRNDTTERLILPPGPNVPWAARGST